MTEVYAAGDGLPVLEPGGSMLFYLTVILACQLAGETVVVALGLPLPGPVLGMVILFVGMLIKGSIPQGLETTGGALLDNLSLLFVPAGVGVMLHGALIGRDWLAVSAALIVSTLATILVTGWLMARLAPGAGDD